MNRESLSTSDKILHRMVTMSMKEIDHVFGHRRVLRVIIDEFRVPEGRDNLAQKFRMFPNVSNIRSLLECHNLCVTNCDIPAMNVG